MLRAQEISDIATCRQAILAGQKRRAATWLAQQPVSPEIAVLTALNHPTEPLSAWQKALALLTPLGPSEDLLSCPGVSSDRLLDGESESSHL